MSNTMQSPPAETDELLQRILKAVEPPKTRHGMEIACAVLLSLATTASAWCAYQSKLWGGAQMARGNAAAAAVREAAVNMIQALQERAFDASMFISYAQAKAEKNQPMELFLAQRFRPEMKTALDAWLKLEPLTNPSAPSSPLQMPEYVQKKLAEAARLETVATAAAASSRQARKSSDNYVLLTVLFASVLFFGGTARAFESPRLRTVLAVMAVVLFLATLTGLLTMPICHE